METFRDTMDESTLLVLTTDGDFLGRFRESLPV